MIRYVALFFLALLVEKNSIGSERNAISVTQLPMSIWQLVSAIEVDMPLSVAKVERMIGVKLNEIERSDHYVIFGADENVLATDFTVSNVRLMLRSSLHFDDKSAFGFEIEGKCIPRSEIEQHYGELRLIQAPRGRSLDETAVWASERPWGILSFAFKERTPDCLFRVSFRKQMP